MNQRIVHGHIAWRSGGMFRKLLGGREERHWSDYLEQWYVEQQYFLRAFGMCPLATDYGRATLPNTVSVPRCPILDTCSSDSCPVMKLFGRLRSYIAFFAKTNMDADGLTNFETDEVITGALLLMDTTCRWLPLKKIARS